MRRALARAEAADIVVLVLDGTAADPFAGIPEAARARAALTVWNKADLPFPEPRQGLAISARTGQGLPDLIAALTGLVREQLAGAGEAPVLTRARHRRALEDAATALGRALAAPSGAPELAAEDMRLGSSRARPHHRPRRCRGTAGCCLPRLLYREVKNEPRPR